MWKRVVGCVYSWCDIFYVISAVTAEARFVNVSIYFVQKHIFRFVFLVPIVIKCSLFSSFTLKMLLLIIIMIWAHLRSVWFLKCCWVHAGFRSCSPRLPPPGLSSLMSLMLDDRIRGSGRKNTRNEMATWTAGESVCLMSDWFPNVVSPALDDA